MTEISGLRGLRQFNPAGSEFPAALVRLLGAQKDIRASSLTVKHVDAVPETLPGFHTASGIIFAIASAAGLSLLPDTSDLVAACNALDAADTELTHIERALSIALTPTDLIAASEWQAPEAENAVIELSSASHQIYLRIPRSHPNTNSWIKAAQNLVPRLSELPVLVQLSLTGPRLPLADASGISGGDLLMLGRSLIGNLHIVGAAEAALPGNGASGQFDLRSGVFSVGDGADANTIGGHMDTEGEFTPDEQIGAKQFGALQVPVTIRLQEKLVQAADLAALRPGSTLPLGAMVQGLVADLVVGGKILAKGEIVQIGDSFALLVEDINGVGSHANAKLVEPNVPESDEE